MIPGEENRLLMSDSLVGLLPEIQDKDFNSPIDFSIVVNLDLISSNFNIVLVGSLVSCSFEIATSKLSIKLDLKTSHEFLKKYTSSGFTCRNAHLYLGDDDIHLEGPYQVCDPKISDIDKQLKMCTLEIALIKLGQ